MAKITRALISVSDKRGVIEFSKVLAGYGVEILSTGGTAKLLRDAGLTVKDVSEFTGFPEMLDGRVKTLHPKVHGGLLGMRGNPEHVAKMKEHGIENIDMVVVNLYPFESTVAKEGCKLKTLSRTSISAVLPMLRSAAKNHQDVTVLVDAAADYASVLDTKCRPITALFLRRPISTWQSRYSSILLPMTELSPIIWGQTWRFRRGVSGNLYTPGEKGAKPALWREPAADGSFLCGKER